MNITWKDDGYYYQGSIPDGEDIITSIQLLVTKVLELAKDKEDWNCVMMDMWMYNLGRLICNVQNNDEAVGKDRGFRVALQFKEYYNVLESTPQSEYNMVLHNLKIDLSEKIKEAYNDEDFLMSFDELWLEIPFTVRVASQGQLLNFEIKFA